MTKSRAQASASTELLGRAVEHAGYMADSAEHLLAKLNALSALYGEDGQEHDPDDVCNAETEVAEATRDLRNMIYEFRKRADKARPNAD